MADLEGTLQGFVRVGERLVNLNRILAAAPVVGGKDFQILFDNEESLRVDLAVGETLVSNCRAVGLVRAGRALVNANRLLSLRFEPAEQVETKNPAHPSGYFKTAPQYVAVFDIHTGPLKGGFQLPAEDGRALLSIFSDATHALGTMAITSEAAA